MNRTTLSRIVSLLVAAGALAATIYTRSAAIAEGAGAGAKMSFALSLIALLVGLAAFGASFFPKKEKVDVRTMVLAALFAALSYVGFAYLKIDIPAGPLSTAFHLGNVFVVLGALFLGGYWGGMAGAVGLTIADLTTQYVMSAPKTFLLKLCIGLISGFVAHQVFHISEGKEKRKVPLLVATALSAAAGMAFNVVADPVVGYFYKQYLLGIPQEAAKIWAKIGAVTTLTNAVIAVIAATVLYLAARKPLQRSGLLGK